MVLGRVADAADSADVHVRDAEVFQFRAGFLDALSVEDVNDAYPYADAAAVCLDEVRAGRGSPCGR